jgi:hypothetical protein
MMPEEQQSRPIVTVTASPVARPRELLQAGPDSYYPLIRGETLDALQYGVWEESEPRWIAIEPHRAREIGCYAFNDVTVFNADYLFRDGAFIDADGLFPVHHPTLIRGNGYGNVPTGPARVRDVDIEEPSFAILYRQAMNYGHFLVEILPKMYIVEQLRLLGVKAKVIISSITPDFGVELLRTHLKFGKVRYDPRKEALRVRRLLAPSHIGFHPALRAFFWEFRAKALKGYKPPPEVLDILRAEGIYISRRQHRKLKGWDWRKVDEDQVETLARSEGLAVVEPQLLTIRDQVFLFSHTRFIVGEYSSALHNAVFSPIGTTILSFNWLNSYQERLSQLLSHRLVFLTQPRKTEENEQIVVDDDRLIAAIRYLKRTQQ